ncbi:MAG: lipoyl synthase [Chloroflexota bacterium]
MSPPGTQPIPVLPRPDWLRVRFPTGPNYLELKNLVRGRSLHTVCEEAHCPNIGECWQHRTATFMILGRVCTRACRFCAITTGLPIGVDREEPDRVAQAVEELGLRHVVVTSVARDDLPDGGAGIFAETIRAIRRRLPTCSVEVLIPDLEGSAESLRILMEARPDILNHNIETVERLQRKVRAKAFYARSLEVLRRAKAMEPGSLTKSGMMLGLGETREEIGQALRDLRAVDCDIVTIGQYLRPSEFHLPIVRYVPPAEFAEIKAEGMALGFKHVESGPLVRSSYHAHEQVQRATA